MNAEVVERVAELMESKYPFAEPAERTAAALRDCVGESESVDGPALADALTDVLRKHTNDLHLRVRWSEDRVSVTDEDQWEDPEFLARYWAEQDFRNQGISKAERLPGNIGLLVVHTIDEPEGNGRILEAAFEFLARTDALIIDVRQSNGGAPTGVAFLVSHLVEPPQQKLLTTRDRTGAVLEQSFTSAYVRAPRYVGKPVYVLTSGRTPSGAEELAYDLQAMGRATVVGETTVGAANPVGLFVVGEHHLLALPIVYVEHAITGTNWEGRGVEPDLPCPADQALDVACRAAARALLDGPAPPHRPGDVTAELTALVGG